MKHDLPHVTLKGIPDAAELQRVVDDFFDRTPISTAYKVIEGDQEFKDEHGGTDLDDVEQDRVIATAVKYLWLKAVRKRLAKP